MRRVLRLGGRFILAILTNGTSLMLAIWLTPGIAWEPAAADAIWGVVFALLVGLVNALIRPMLVYLAYPVNVLTVGIPTILLDSILLLGASLFWPGFRVDSYWPSAVIGAVILPASNILLTALTDPERHRTLYDLAVFRLARRAPASPAPLPRRGMILIEIDGLSYADLRVALRRGVMPTLEKILQDGLHRVIAWRCGFPSQTSSVQAGILYGDNRDIPAFRWYDRELGRVLVSNRPDGARTIDERCRRRRPGLLSGGSSINNILSGDARTNIFTVSAVADADRPSRRIEDLLLFVLNPYCVARVLALALWDLFHENLGVWRQHLQREKVTVSRRGLYPFFRVMTNIVLRELSTYMLLLDIHRGTPIVYVTYLGYDEISHHAGPSSPDVNRALMGIDDQIQRARKAIARYAPISYDLIILSDHGQSASIPFRQLRREPIQALVSRLLNGQDIGSSEGEGDAALPGPLIALLAELQEVERLTTGRLAPRALERGRKALQRLTSTRAQITQEVQPSRTGALVLHSGPVAHIYFGMCPEPMTLEHIGYRQPSLLPGLLQTEGIGFIAGRSETRGPLVLGRQGFRELSTGRVEGDDPLAPYGDVEYIASQMRRVLSFPNAGDILVHGGYHEGRLVVFEEHVGSHGGFGGAQMLPFLIYPSRLSLDGRRPEGAEELYPLLWEWRRHNGVGDGIEKDA